MKTPPPRFLFLQVNKRCNLKCVHCDFWKQRDDDRQNYLSRSRRSEILTEYASMNPYGRVVICGGEPMLDIDEYFDICSSSRALGLRCLSVVNGTRIKTMEMATRLMNEGPHEISISLNSHRELLHDQTRGVTGSYRKALNALNLLLQARKNAGQHDTNVIVMGLIFSQNYREIEQFYDFVLNDIGADKLKLNFIQPKFGQLTSDDTFFGEETDLDADELLDILHRCNQKFGLKFNPAWMEQVHMYFKSLSTDSTRIRGWGTSGHTTDHICNSYERNIMIDHYGFARLCFSNAFSGMQLSRPGDLTAFWTGSDKIRCKMRRCNAYCGISHSVRREASTVAGNAFAQEHAQRHQPVRRRFDAESMLRAISPW